MSPFLNHALPLSALRLTLLTAPGCHLCGHGREVLESLRGELGVGWREVSTESAEGTRLAAKAPPLRPVLFAADGTAIACGRLSERGLRRDLSALLTTSVEAGSG